jgi:RecB family exonuclease
MSEMDLHVILGPPGAGKAGRAVATLRSAAETGVDAFLCVPGAVDRARFLRELAAAPDGSGSGLLLGVEVGTFDQLIARIAGSPPVRRTDRAMERIVVRDALQDLPSFAAAARWAGFVDTAREQVDRLRRARVWGGVELERVEAELPGEDVEHWRRLEQRVGELLQERRLRDDAWFERRAAQALRKGVPGVGAVVVYGFETLPPARIELLERLAAHIPVAVTLAWRPGRRVHERAADLRDRWRARGAFVEELDAAPAADPTLGWLGSELFEDAPSAAPVREPDLLAPAPVAFVDCCGSLQEAEEVVREVALLAGNGYAWDDIAVASANAATDGELLLAAFERAGIPARLQARRRAIDVPAGRALHELLDAIVTGDALRLVAALRSPIFGLDPALVDRTEVRLRGERHRAGDLLHARVLRRMLPAQVATLADLRRGADAAVPAVRELLSSLLPADLGELDLLRGIAALVEGLVIAAGSEQRVALVDVRDAVAAFPLTTPDRSDSGTVVIASLDDLRSVAFDALVLRGMHLAGFRARVDDDAEAPAAGRDLLHLAVTRARRTLRVVRQAAGADGGHLAPSPAWQELRRLQPDAPLRIRRLGEVVVSPDAVRLASESRGAVAFAQGRGLEVLDVDPALATRIASYRRTSRSTQLTGELADELAAITQLSVTAVERYAVCSAKWFIEQQLKVGDPDDDRSRIAEGILAHALLQQLVPDARLRGLTGDALRERATTIAPEVAADVDTRGVLDRARIERITEHVVALIETEANWLRPDDIEVERSFGRDAPDSIGPGYLVDGVEVVGRIDRIDRHGSYALLHDYKYGSTDRPARTLIQDRNLQLLVYWLALEQPGTLMEPIGAMYRAVTKAGAPSGVLSDRLREIGIISARQRAGVLDEETRTELLAEAADLVAGTVAGIRSGRVEPLADPAMCPTHCHLQTICRVGEVVA